MPTIGTMIIFLFFVWLIWQARKEIKKKDEKWKRN